MFVHAVQHSCHALCHVLAGRSPHCLGMCQTLVVTNRQLQVNNVCVLLSSGRVVPAQLHLTQSSTQGAFGTVLQRLDAQQQSPCRGVYF
jgi:hypothetical protein